MPGAGRPFPPGQSGNPGGKPVAAKNRLQGDFLNALADDFEQHGRAAIEACRTQDPAAYLRIIASLVPKELELKRPLDELSDDELAAFIAWADREIKTDTDESSTDVPLPTGQSH